MLVSYSRAGDETGASRAQQLNPRPTDFKSPGLGSRDQNLGIWGFADGILPTRMENPREKKLETKTETVCIKECVGIGCTVIMKACCLRFEGLGRGLFFFEAGGEVARSQAPRNSFFKP